MRTVLFGIRLGTTPEGYEAVRLAIGQLPYAAPLNHVNDVSIGYNHAIIASGGRIYGVGSCHSGKLGIGGMDLMVKFTYGPPLAAR